MSEECEQLSWLEEAQKGDEQLLDFFNHMSICHSVTVDVENKPDSNEDEKEEESCPLYQ